MIRLFNVYYPTRTIVLLLCEALIVSGCFLLATALLLGPDTYLVLNYEYGGLKILGLTILTLLCSYYFDLYEPQRISARWEIYFRLLLVLGFLSFLLSAIIYKFPGADMPGHYVLLLGLIFLTVALVAWRSAYEWIIGREIFRERVYVLGAGERAQAIVGVGLGSAQGLENRRRGFDRYMSPGALERCRKFLDFRRQQWLAARYDDVTGRVLTDLP